MDISQLLLVYYTTLNLLVFICWDDLQTTNSSHGFDRTAKLTGLMIISIVTPSLCVIINKFCMGYVFNIH